MKIAAFTIVKNEYTFLPVWHKYYAKEIGEENVYIYDNDSEIEPQFCNVRKIRSEYSFDHAWLRRMAFDIMSCLLQDYDYVICTDADEVLIANLKIYDNLNDYIQKNSREILYSTGYEVLGTKNDIAIDFTGLLIKQRNLWVKLKNFYKPVISCIPLRKMYSDYNCAQNGDPDLYLVHLNRIDYNTALTKNKLERTYKWSPEELKRTNGWQHRINNDKQFDEYFHNIKNAATEPEEIPKWVIGVV